MACEEDDSEIIMLITHACAEIGATGIRSDVVVTRDLSMVPNTSSWRQLRMGPDGAHLYPRYSLKMSGAN
jgi:hypothetical protein